MAEQKVKLTQLPEASDTIDEARLLINQNDTDQQLPVNHFLRGKKNLSDLTNIDQARANLGVLSVDEVNDKLSGFIDGKYKFSTGGTLSSENSFIWDDESKSWYYWSGLLPKEVPASSTPDSTGGIGEGAWDVVGDAILRRDLSSTSGAEMIGLSQGMTAQAAFDQFFTQTQFVTPEQFLANHPGETDWAIMIQDAYDFAIANNKTVLLANVYQVKSSIKHLAGLSVLQTGVICADPAGDFTTVDAAGNSYKAVYHIMSEGTVYSDKRTYIPRIHIRHTQNIDWGTVYYPHVDAIGVLMTHIAGVVVGQMETWGMLRGGADLGGIPSIGYEIAILHSCFGIMRWESASAVGLWIRTGDSHFVNPITIDYPIGIRISGTGANTLVDPHPWGHPKTSDNLYPNRQMLIGFELISGGHTIYRPYADSVAKLDPNSGATMDNGGYGFVIRSTSNTIHDVVVTSHNEQVVTSGLPFYAAYLVGDVNNNLFDLKFLGNKTTHFSTQPITWDGDRPTTPWRNNICGFKSEIQTNAALTGSIGFDGSSVTQSGAYTARRDGEHVDLHVSIDVTAAAGGNGLVAITLPRGLGFYPGAGCDIEIRTALGNGLPTGTVDVIGFVPTGATDFTKIQFYAVTADGTRTFLTYNHVKAGVLRFVISGKISNG